MDRSHKLHLNEIYSPKTAMVEKKKNMRREGGWAVQVNWFKTQPFKFFFLNVAQMLNVLQDFCCSDNESWREKFVFSPTVVDHVGVSSVQMHHSVLIFNFTSLSSPQLRQLQFALTVSRCDIFACVYIWKDQDLSAHT